MNGLCGAQVKQHPKATADGKCSVCGAKLEIKSDIKNIILTPYAFNGCTHNWLGESFIC